MQLHYYPLLIFFVSIFCLCSCDINEHYEEGNGVIVSEMRPVKSFNAIRTGGNIDIILQEANDEAVEIVADENLIEFIELQVDSKTLSINSRKALKSDEGIKVFISYNNLRSIEAGGAGKIAAENILEMNRLDVIISGAAMVNLPLNVRHLDLKLSGAGMVELSGSAKNQELRLSGAGNLDASDLISENCSISISGVGGAEVYVTQELDVSVSGVGGVVYYGNPSEIQKDVSGMGKIEMGEEDSKKVLP